MPTPPKVLTDVGYEIYCDIHKLWELDVPVVDFPIANLAWNFELPFWKKDGTHDWNLTPREVLENVPGSSEHRRRVEGVDLRFPILLTQKHGRWLVIDGVHRLVKAHEAGQTTIKAKIFTEEVVALYPSEQ